MFRTSLLTRSICLRATTAAAPLTNAVKFSPLGFIRHNSSLDKLRDALATSETKGQQPAKEDDRFANINDLLSSTLAEASSPSSSTSFQRDFGLSRGERHPRDIAKRIREFGTNAGRTVYVTHGGVDAGFGSLTRVANENRIKYLQRVQARFIRPAKYRKQLRREWWRRHFKENFKKMMHQVNEATRRGY